MNSFTYIFLIALAIGIALQWWLKWRQVQAVSRHQHAVPPAFADKISLGAHQKAAAYTIEKTRFAQTVLIIDAVILLMWTLGGGLQWLDQSWRMLEWSNLWTGVAVIVSMMLISNLLGLPSSLYSTFHIEEKYGFNRSTWRLFFIDELKGLILALVISVPLIAVVLWLMETAGSYWWLYAWIVLISFQFLLLWAYPTFIAPWFNQFQPLEDNVLKQRIEALLNRNGFKVDGVFVMDGSKRSSHGNAYFTGLGNNKRIVFFDTLLKELNHDEMEAVLAHEVGHFKRKHIQKRLISMSIFSLLALALLGWLIDQTWFYQGLGVTTPSTYMGLILFGLVVPVFTIFLQPIMAWFSRKQEFEADEFASQQVDSQFLVQALVKLYQENASTLTPDSWHSAFYESHPPALVRIEHLHYLDNPA